MRWRAGRKRYGKCLHWARRSRLRLWRHRILPRGSIQDRQKGCLTPFLRPVRESQDRGRGFRARLARQSCDRTRGTCRAFADQGRGGPADDETGYIKISPRNEADIERFGQKNKPYGRRVQAETVNSMIKRNIGDSLRARSEEARSLEQLLRVLTHNVMIIPYRTRVETEPLRPRFIPLGRGKIVGIGYGPYATANRRQPSELLLRSVHFLAGRLFAP